MPALGFPWVLRVPRTLCRQLPAGLSRTWLAHAKPASRRGIPGRTRQSFPASGHAASNPVHLASHPVMPALQQHRTPSCGLPAGVAPRAGPHGLGPPLRAHTFPCGRKVRTGSTW